MMPAELHDLWLSLQDAEYLYLLLEPLPVFGLFFALLAMGLSLMLGERKLMVFALLVVTLSGASVWPTGNLRADALPRVIATRDEAFVPLVKEQSARRQSWDPAYYALAAVALLGLITGAGGKGKWFSHLALLGCLLLFWVSLWLHKKDAEIYHRNIVKHRAP